MKVLHDRILIQLFKNDLPSRIVVTNQINNRRAAVIAVSETSGIPQKNPHTGFASEVIVSDLGQAYDIDHRTMFFVNMKNVLLCNGLPTKQFIGVRISKKEQERRRNMTDSGLYLDERWQFFQRNVQCGEVVSIGSKKFPGLEIGDKLIFHHSIEGSVEARAQRYTTKYLIDADKDYHYYCVREDLAYGYSKDNKTIVPSNDWVFAKTKHIQKVSPIITDGGVIGTSFHETFNDKQKRLEELQKQSAYLAQSLNVQGVKEKIEDIMAEMKSISKEMQRKRIEDFEPVWTPEEYSGAKKIYYKFIGEKPIEVEALGQTYHLLSTNFIETKEPL